METGSSRPAVEGGFVVGVFILCLGWGWCVCVCVGGGVWRVLEGGEC
jgi:hypothetical protein